MTAITRRPLFWLAFAALSALSALFAWHYFPQALPLINLDVKMTRDQALDRAVALADKLALIGPGARRAVLFAHDGATQNFVELEGGGKPAFTALLSGELYAPFWWEVRLFKPGETAEVRLRFKPDGTPYGLHRKVAESEPGSALAAPAARAIAEARAKGDWAIDFAPYRLLEQSQVQRPNGRVDHTFVYEREQEKLGDGRFRLRLTVTGDALTEVTHRVHIPEAFERRFHEMRSVNNTIARAATLTAGALYGVGGCIVGVLWLLRRRWLLWRPALVAGAIVASLNALALLANAPQAWFGYDTAHSTAVFWGQQVGLAVLVFVAGSLALALVFMAAESLSRRAFPDHPQLWRLWSRVAAPTPSILGRTLGGYLFVPIELAIVAAFYFVTNRYFGWWQPSESLTDPNILGNALPALAPIGMALQAGFMEECLFRAVPLSIAALVGARFRVRRLAIGVALLIEALVFGAAHANYPGFPAYSRLVELIGPAIIWGLIFLRFGLLPTVILHAVFDLVLMSIPVFLVQGQGSGLNQALVIFAGLVPLAVVFGQRALAGKWLVLPPLLRNRAWQAAAAVATVTAARIRAEAGAWSARAQRVLPLLGIAGLLAVALAGDFHSDAPPLKLDRAEAEATADVALKERGVTLGPEWRRFAATRLASEDSSVWLWHKFVWREAGHDAYAKLMGTWLAPPLWEVRYARFEGGDVADRAEEWRVLIEGDGSVRQIRHQLPENRPGAKLSREDTRTLAQQEIGQRFGLDPAALQEVSAEERVRDARTDWQFTYVDRSIDAGKGGEVRALVAIAGNEIAFSGRYVFVPETWQRAERERAGRLGIAKNVVALIAVLVGLAALIAAIVAWSRHRFDRHAFWLVSGLIFAASAVNAINQWPLVGIRLSTAEPLATQLGVAVGVASLGAVMSALLAGLLAGVAVFAARAHVEPELTPGSLWLRGAWVALVTVGADLLIGSLWPDTMPDWPTYKAEDTWLPWLARITGPVSALLGLIAAMIIVLYWLDRMTAGWTRRRVLAGIVLVLASGAAAALKADQWIEIIATGVVGGAVATVLFGTVLRFDLRAVPGLAAVYLAIHYAADAALKGTPWALLLAVIAIATLLLLSWAATGYLYGGSAESTVTSPIPEGVYHGGAEIHREDS